MADALNPWLLPYLTEIAETFGAQIHTVPLHEKKKKIQITEFLTYGSAAEPTYIWGQVADKHYIIPIKFSKDAVAEFELIAHYRLTQCRGAIVTIKKFKPMFTRIPGSNGNKSSSSSYLALECDSVSLLGCVGESTFGDPKSIVTHPDMQLWSQGLSESGGAGNILKERKQEAESHDKVGESSKRQSLMPPPAAPPPQDVVVKKKPLSLKSVEVTNLDTYRARWQIVEKNPAYRHPPWQNEDAISPKQAGDREAKIWSGRTVEAFSPKQTDNARERTAEFSQSPVSRASTPAKLLSQKQTDIFPRSPEGERSKSPRSRSATPFASWEASSPILKSSADDKGVQATNNTSLALPTPAQRVKRPISTPDLIPSSPYPFGNDSVADIEPDISSSQAVSAMQHRPVVPRRVPRPTSPQPRRTMGPERVLVPNSDTSGTQSQSLTQSQSQSQSQPRLQVQVEASSSRKTDKLKEVETDIDKTNVKKDRKRSPSKAKSDSSPPRGVRSTPAKWEDGNERDFAESSSSSGSGSGANEYEGFADEERVKLEEDDYPWIGLRRIREIIADAEAHRLK